MTGPDRSPLETLLAAEGSVAPDPEPLAPEIPGDRAREFVVPNLPVQEPLDPEAYDPDPYEPELPGFGLASASPDTARDTADLTLIVTAHPDIDHRTGVDDPAL